MPERDSKQVDEFERYIGDLQLIAKGFRDGDIPIARITKIMDGASYSVREALTDYSVLIVKRLREKGALNG